MIQLGTGSGSTQLLTGAAVSLVLAWVIYRWIRSRNYPPGPRGLPVLGYLPFLGARPNLKLTELRKKYGDIFSAYLGPNLYVFISDYETAKELLSMNELMARQQSMTKFLPGGGGFVGMNGWPWQEQRRFCFHTMRDLGLGKGPWELMTQEDAMGLVEEIQTWNGKPTDFFEILSISQVNNNIDLLIGRRLDKVKSKDLIHSMHETARSISKSSSPVGVLVSFPILAVPWILLRIGSYHKMKTQIEQFEMFLRKEVDERIKEKDSWERGDFIGSYLQQMEQRENDSNPHNFTVDNLIGNMFMLFLTGTDTSMAAISWLMYLMASHQDIQKKVHEEIDEAVGRDRFIYHDDRTKTPYVMATILEMQRWASIAPLFPPRNPYEDLTFQGCTLPKDCYVVVNNWSISHDPRYFENPMEFSPERFMEGKKLKSFRVDGYIPFSVGRRNCPGEGTVMMTTFLHFVHIMQKFHITTPHGGPANLEGVFGATVLPVRQELCFRER